ncbi:unnamed protein product [Dovyalis caffra]|uniref:Uncharacterized protein n=1 Tax=Dovyalis caffra TaxID=77055 RepID=A0AAV1S8Z6_9ROSI|nr:unnamed protein product [Dovyalis caffra]
MATETIGLIRTEFGIHDHESQFRMSRGTEFRLYTDLVHGPQSTATINENEQFTLTEIGTTADSSKPAGIDQYFAGKTGAVGTPSESLGCLLRNQLRRIITS